MNKSLWFLLIGTAMLATSCSRKISLPILTEPKTALNIEEISFENFQGKARMILRDANKERDVKANIRIRRDSAIWMNFSVIGVQGGRALINKDSITIISNVDKEYYVFDYKELSERYNFEINYNVIEAAMLGNLIHPRQNDDEVVRESSMFILKQELSPVTITNFINAVTMKIEKVEMREENSTNSFVISYSNFQPIGNKLFPFNGTINLFYKTLAGTLNTTIIFEYNKAELVSKDKIPPFNIPKRYARR